MGARSTLASTLVTRFPAAALALLGAVALPLTGCTTRHLEAMGYSDVEIIGYGFLACPEDALNRTLFEATALGGDQVAGVLSQSAFGGPVVR